MAPASTLKAAYELALSDQKEAGAAYVAAKFDDNITTPESIAARAVLRGLEQAVSVSHSALWKQIAEDAKAGLLVTLTPAALSSVFAATSVYENASLGSMLQGLYGTPTASQIETLRLQIYADI